MGSSVRLTAAQVNAIMEDSSSMIGFNLAPFISASHQYVEERLGSTDLSETLLTEIERWVAAHFATVKRRRTTREKIGPAEDEYTLRPGEGIMMTDYGQMAVSLDTSGRLVEAGKPRAQVTACDVLTDENVADI
jgi:hypothetical protein